MEAINTYLIFVDRNDAYNSITIECERSLLNYALRKEELLGDNESYTEMDWNIYENGVMIQG